MSVSIKVPSVGESVTEGVIAEWLKKDGDFVNENEPLFELETDKASQEIPAPATGVLHITIEEGETVTIGAEVGAIEEKVRADNQETAPIGEMKDHVSKQRVAEKIKPEEQTAENELLALSPAVRSLVADNHIDVGQINATGRDGRITKEDVLLYLDGQSKGGQADDGRPSALHGDTEKAEHSSVPCEGKAPAESGEKRQRMSALRQRIAQKLVSSQQETATLTTFNEADMSSVLELRKRFKEKFKEKHAVNLGFMSFFVKACVAALKAFPLINGRIDGNEIVTHDYCNIGVAVSTEKGLMVPVVRHAENLTFAEIEQTILHMADKARSGKISVDDLQGGTFTITNGGVYGSLQSTPILYPQQSGILGMHTIQKRPVVVNDEIVIRPMMYLALSYDHRLIDGREAVQFLVRVKERIEDPNRMLIEV